MTRGAEGETRPTHNELIRSVSEMLPCFVGTAAAPGRVQLLAFLFLIGGCSSAALQHMPIRLTPNLPVVSVDIGQGAKIHLRVVDERPKTTENHATAASAINVITTSDDQENTLRTLFAERLSKLRFDLRELPDDEVATLEIKLRKLAYGIYSTKPRRIYIDASIAAGVNRHPSPVIEKSYYRSYSENLPAMGANADWLEKRVNQVVSRMIEIILSDLELLAALK